MNNNNQTLNIFSHHFWLDNKKWKKACINTFICLIGCSIGDLGMITFLQGMEIQLSMRTSMLLAMGAGLISSICLEAVILKIKEKFSWLVSFQAAFSMSFLSMIAMEIAENFTDYWLTSGKVPISDPYYWIALLISMGAAFFVPLPYNYYKLKKHNKSCH